MPCNVTDVTYILYIHPYLYMTHCPSQKKKQEKHTFRYLPSPFRWMGWFFPPRQNKADLEDSDVPCVSTVTWTRSSTGKDMQRVGDVKTHAVEIITGQPTIHFQGRTVSFREGTLPKFNMELENTPLEREIIFQTIIFGFYVSFRGCRNVLPGKQPLTWKFPSTLSLKPGIQLPEKMVDYVFQVVTNKILQMYAWKVSEISKGSLHKPKWCICTNPNDALWKNKISPKRKVISQIWVINRIIPWIIPITLGCLGCLRYQQDRYYTSQMLLEFCLVPARSKNSHLISFGMVFW